ncbi:MFS transporter [Amycolatopsis sp. H20-H5]|uniref:MFS transporter n=1 Tax=Amycolatopsis sp. H20-H5 TaxID=3046309 RepID=UPI002DBC1B40|nr:MFS transporter [Amycolatopsis sp. H20-H5]MEC3976598.1 MFS transporter [Amycolatopsis sp. H20-H5]
MPTRMFPRRRTGAATVTRPDGGEPIGRLATASFMGTAIEFFDFYAYSIAAALVLDKVFFPLLDPVSGKLAAFSTYAVAFLSRPLGAMLFGHWGDRIGRKAMLISSLLLMGLSTFAIGLLPGYATIGVLAPILLVVLRFLQGIGLGGEWGGAALLATEHAPPGKRGLYGMFPQLGPSVGFIAANGLFLLMGIWLTDDQFKGGGWRIPFLFSIVLVLIGLYVRVQLSETPAFMKALKEKAVERVPLVPLLKEQWRQLLLGSGAMMVQYTLFYTATAYCLSYGTSVLKIPKSTMLTLTLLAVVVLGLCTAFTAIVSDRWGRRRVLLGACVLAVGWGLVMFPLIDSKNSLLIFIALAGALGVMGLSYGPMGAYLPELFQTRYRYTGAALAYSLGGVLGGALPPLISTGLQADLGSWAVGGYVTLVALISLGCVAALRETKDRALD